MSITTAPTTFADLQTFTANACRVNTAETAAMSKLKRLLNTGLQDLAIQAPWPWLERRARLVTHAPYTTGTCATSTSARTTVTGTSTAWNTAVAGYGFTNARAGGKVRFSGEDIPYLVASVAGDTSLTLESSWVGDTALSGASYTYYEDEYALASDFFRPVDLKEFSETLRLPILTRSDFYRLLPANRTSGTPKCCTFIDTAPSGSTARVQKVVFAPYPSASLSVEYRYVTVNLAVSSAGVAAEAMSADTDEPVLPLRFRHALVHYAAENWYRDAKDDSRSAEHAGKYVDLVTRIKQDSAPEGDRPRFYVDRLGRRRGLSSPRFTTGTRWDRFSE